MDFSPKVGGGKRQMGLRGVVYDLSEKIVATLIDCQKKFHPLQSGKAERGCGHFFHQGAKRS